MENEMEQTIDRRDFFQRVGMAGVALAAAGSTLVGSPKGAAASDVEALIAEHFGSNTVTMGKVEVDLPDKAENGALVRIPVIVDHPMEPDNYIQSIGLFVDNNPKPFVGRFDLLPESGKASIECRIKVAKSSKIRVIAKSNSGKLYGFEKNVEVAEGGCAG